MTLLTHRRDIGANLAKDFSSGHSTKAARDFLLNLHHSDISFRLVIIKRHVEIIHKGKSFSAIIAEPVKQILGFGLFLAPSLPFASRLGRSISSKSFSQNSQIASLKFSHDGF